MEKANAIDTIRRVAIVGPESTGKTTLAEQLAKHYNTVFVAEYAREYINNLKRPYSIDDIVTISKRQMEMEDKLSAEANKILICDTSLLVTKIWAEFKYSKCPAWIEEHYHKRHYNLHLLCNTDTPWEYDTQREHPHLRQELFAIYKQELDKRRNPYVTISGLNNARTDAAIRAIDNLW